MVNNKWILQILKNQRSLMIWLSKGDYTQGYFSKNIKDTESILDFTIFTQSKSSTHQRGKYGK